MVISFYSFKGGVGRSMALANVAQLFYEQGFAVVVVDWDLEAPGLERFFTTDTGALLDRPGVIDLLVAYKAWLARPEPRTQAKPDAPYGVDLNNYLIELQPPAAHGGSLRLMPAGKRSDFAKYAAAVHEFDWDDFYTNWEGELFFEWFRTAIARDSRIVFLDSRTGITEMGGVCTFHLADLIVMLCAANEQNLEGCFSMAERYLGANVQTDRGGRQLRVVVAPARLETHAEGDELTHFQQAFLNRFRSLLRDRLGVDVESYWALGVPYVPHYAFRERLAVADRGLAKAKDLLSAFDRLAKEVANFAVAFGRTEFRRLAEDVTSAEQQGRLATAFLKRLSPEEVRVASEIALRLVRVGNPVAGVPDTSLRIAAAELGAGTARVLQAYIREGLVVRGPAGSGEQARDAEDRLEFAHATIVQGWSQLRQWIEEDREFLLFRQNVRELALEWSVGRGALLPQSVLEESRRWDHRKGDFSEGERRFIEQSLELTGRTIVLLSDDASQIGESGETNVRRLFSAINTTERGNQAAYLDDSRTTSPLWFLGPVARLVGWGVKRSVLDMYIFACRHYASSGSERLEDRLQIFGVGRGAFKCRVLIDFIADQGLISGLRGDDLTRHARTAYRAYRKKSYRLRGLSVPLYAIQEMILRAWVALRGLRPYDSRNNRRARVGFVGLWDTMEAYGLPIQEMTRGWDRWVWPLSIIRPGMPAIVDKVCHALAIDDDREALHPRVLDESAQPPSSHTDQERVTQVWFAGAHSDVGGGFVDGRLAHVSLVWMANEARKRGLNLHEHIVAPWRAQATPHGRLHESRWGLSSYYRYGPRDIGALSSHYFADVLVARPKIHESVFQRIESGDEDYAPIGLPVQYAVVTADGALLDPDANPHEHPTQAESRFADQERVWTAVWLRRLVHVTAVVVALGLVMLPLIDLNSSTFSFQSRTLSGMLDLLDKYIPFLRPFWSYYKQFPLQLILGAIVLANLAILNRALRRTIHRSMRQAWDTTFAAGRRTVPLRPRPNDQVTIFRRHRTYRAVSRYMTDSILPLGFGLGMLAGIVLTTVSTINRVAFDIASAGGQVCVDVMAAAPPSPSGTTVTFNSASMCHATPVTIERGQTYRIQVHVPEGGWFDKSIPVLTTGGFGSRSGVFLAALPFRRMPMAQWFVPFARVGSSGSEYYSLSDGSVQFTAERTGQLFLFVNDAIAPWPYWSFFYTNNVGEATAIVQRLSSDPSRGNP